MAVILVPVNLMPLFFLDQPQGELIAALAITGMALNLPIMMAARGMSGTMALPHLLCWVPLVIVVAGMLSAADTLNPNYFRFLWLLMIVDVISLVFDVRDAAHWMRNRKAG
ncbi:hypothetical protein [Ruegeria profundi]|uniref:hypothetical protein n=1 Tax=Ruegeria profundi TaxID=1685378 RepID=UPI003C7D7F7D